MPLRPVLALQMVLWAFGSTGSADQGGQRQGKEGRREAVPLVRPSNNHLQLEVAEEGLAALQAMDIPVAPLIVIGPYRSGKSFLLNQLLGVGCEEGFGVGHTRDTQTKGVWVWGEAVRRRAEGEGGGSEEVGLVLMDTEGLESTRRIDTYDDRIFAFSAVVSSLLVYNLAEALRESDVAKLSFASKLGKEFLGGLQPSAMLWLIQRDFLGGKTVNDMLREALAEVPNPEGNAEVTAVNDVRQSLKHLAGTSTAFGLAQPHLKRTKLCELGDSELAPEYVSQRDELRKLVHRLAAPKVCWFPSWPPPVPFLWFAVWHIHSSAPPPSPAPLIFTSLEPLATLLTGEISSLWDPLLDPPPRPLVLDSPLFSCTTGCLSLSIVPLSPPLPLASRCAGLIPPPLSGHIDAGHQWQDHAGPSAGRACHPSGQDPQHSQGKSPLAIRSRCVPCAQRWSSDGPRELIAAG